MPLRLQMMQSLQSTSTQSSRGLSKVSAYWVANLYKTKPAVLLNITTLWERDIVNKTLHSDLDSLINTFASKHGRSNYFLSITFLWPLVLPSSQRTVADQCQEVGQLVGTVLSLLHRHGRYQKHLSSHHILSPLLHGAHKFNHWHNQECSRFNATPFTRIHWDRTTVHGILRGYFLWSSRVPNTKSKIVTGTIAASTDYLHFFSFPWRSGNVSIN